MMKILEPQVGKERDYMSLYAHELDIKLGLSTYELGPLVHNSYSWTICACSLTTIFIVPHSYSLSTNLEVLIHRNWFWQEWSLLSSLLGVVLVPLGRAPRRLVKSQWCSVLVALKLGCPIGSNPRACGSILTCDSRAIRGSTVGLLGLTLMMGPFQQEKVTPGPPQLIFLC